jgi:coenzyme PQQ precursor peptide PqqA
MIAHLLGHSIIRRSARREVKRTYKTNSTGEQHMEWTTPQFEEVCLNCEINSYASAKL